LRRWATTRSDGDTTKSSYLPRSVSSGIARNYIAAPWRAAWFATNRERLEAERRERHAERMASWRALMKQHKPTLARTRRALRQKAA
jgi:hypothetical protein